MKLTKHLVLLILTCLFVISIPAQTPPGGGSGGNSGPTTAPNDLSFLTSPASLALWAAAQVDRVHVQLESSAAGSPDSYILAQKTIPYSGAPSLFGIAKALNGTVLTSETVIPASYASVFMYLQNVLPDGKVQDLLVGGASGIPEFNGTTWKLPADGSEPAMYLMSRIFIPVQGLKAAWVVETNNWGWAFKKTLDVWYNEGFYFESSLSGEVFLALEVEQSGGGTSKFVYDLHPGQNGGSRMPMPKILAQIGVRDSQELRDFKLNPTNIYHWVFTWKPEESSRYFGVVPGMIATFDKAQAASLEVGSAVGSARSFTVKRRLDNGNWANPVTIDVPAGQNSVNFNFLPGTYHILPVGMDVCRDWWILTEVDRLAIGKG